MVLEPGYWSHCTQTPSAASWVMGYGVSFLDATRCAVRIVLWFGRPCEYAAQVPAAPRGREGVSVSVPQKTALTSSCATEACTCSANCAKAGDSTVQVFHVVCVPIVVR